MLVIGETKIILRYIIDKKSIWLQLFENFHHNYCNPICKPTKVLPMIPDDEPSEEHPDNILQNEANNDASSNPFLKGCLIVIAIILILSLLLRYLQ
jgi:hypothetical protein